MNCLKKCHTTFSASENYTYAITVGMHPSLKSCTGDNDAPSNVENSILELKIECVPESAGNLVKTQIAQAHFL